MLRLYHVLLGLILLALLPLGAKLVLPHFWETKVEQQPRVTVKSSNPPNPGEGNIWKKILGETNVPTGWQAAACEGNAPLLCVTSKGELLGTVEIAVYQVTKNQDFQNQLVAAGIVPGSQVDYQSQKYQTQVLTALKAWVADQYTVFSKDIPSGKGNEIVFSAYPLQVVPVGKLQGVRYGFAKLKQQGVMQEQYISYVAFDGNALYVISTAFNPGSKTAKFEKIENLAIFQPYLDAIAANLNLSMPEQSGKP